MKKSIFRSVISLSGLIIFILPALLILGYEIYSPIGQSNPFLIIFLLMYGGIPALVGLVIFLILHPRIKFKALGFIAAVMLYLMLLPAIWGINSLKESILLAKHQVVLEQISNDLLQNKIVIAEANELLQSKNISITVTCIPKENEHVIYLFGGMIDNCYGIAFSLSGNEPSENCCGEFTSWGKKKGNWYIWTTT
jgi:hypothetical protein